MPYRYYYRLSARRRRIYDLSDRAVSVPLPEPATVGELLPALTGALSAGKQPRVRQAASALVNEICRQLDAPPVRVRVLAKRPSNASSELHGLYEPAEHNTAGRITVWMRTAKRQQVVAFKTFLRTLLHEALHHLDYEWLKLEESFHTEGFYKRESHLVRQLLGPPGDAGKPRAGGAPAGRAAARPR